MTDWKGAATAVAIAIAIAPTPASAKIRCSPDGFQYVQGSWLSTPYCQDGLVGKVARQYGVRVSDAEIRWNPNRKAEVCRFVGHDIRIRNACQGFEGDRRRF